MEGTIAFKDVLAELESAGWKLIRIRGRHRYFDRPGAPRIAFPVDRRRVKREYVKQIQRIIADEADPED